MKVSIIVTNYNGKDLLAKNLPAVVAAGKEPGNKIAEIIVVDDGSNDGSVRFLKRSFSEVKVVQHRKNRGFSATVNTGVRTASGEDRKSVV